MVDVLVEFDYDAEQEDELTIKVGDVIKNVQMSEGGWWEGELNGKKGMFPDNFVKVIEKKKEEPKKEMLVTQQRSSVRELANKLKDVHVGAAPQKKKDQHHHSDIKRKKAKVLFDYEPENEDELKIEVGDIVEVIKQEEEGWWEGVLNGKTGVFPSNFVEVIEEGEPNDAVDSHPPAEEKPESKGKKVMGVGLGNIFEGGPIKLRSTAATAKRPVEKPDPKPIATEEPPVLKREKPAPVEKAVVRYSYSADNEDELNLKENDIIVILDKDLEDAGWWKGEINGKIGVFPDNFVELIPLEEQGIDKFSRPLGSNKIPPQGSQRASSHKPKPKKPPPPSAVLNQQKPKTLEKEKSVDQKQPPPVIDSAADRLHKKPEHEKTAPPLLPGKKPVLPPPVGKKPTKPDPPKPVLDGKPHTLGGAKEEPSSHRDIHKDIPHTESHFDGIETTSERLVHLTANRPRGPAKRPPSQVILNNDEDRNGDVDMQIPKLPSSVKEVSEEPPVHIPPKEKQQSLPARPPEPNVASSGVLAMVEELKREIRELKTNSVSKAAYNELKTENDKLRQEFESFKTTCSRKIRDLTNEVDEEKKIRLSTEVEMKRIKKMVNDESHV
uniref:SH3 domain-containing kinase-binding protein 1-like isoform X11 n=1 Tax=Crassostrea virginica TaxID=6565 RepID=A0A8B8AQF3_CRAVI|nr:SH3 domain-containing kinase-binding protein 1-like isoform X11 [Crassostrea virginica]